MVFEYFRTRIDRARAADNDAQIVFCQAVFEPLLPEFYRAGPHGGGCQVNSARARHHRVRHGAQFQQMLAIMQTAK